MQSRASWQGDLLPPASRYWTQTKLQYLSALPDWVILVLVLQVDLTRLPRRDAAMETLLGEVMARAAGDVLQYNVPKTMDACEVVAELMKTHGTPYFICIDEVQVSSRNAHLQQFQVWSPELCHCQPRCSSIMRSYVTSFTVRLSLCLSGMSVADLCYRPSEANFWTCQE